MKPPTIQTDYGPVSEMARRQAAENMRKDPAVRERVEDLLIEKMGVEAGQAQARWQFREAYGWRRVWLNFKDRIGI